MAPAGFAMLKVSLLGVTVTIGRDDESEAHSPDRQPGTKPGMGTGPDQSRWAAMPGRLADSCCPSDWAGQGRSLPLSPAVHREQDTG